MSLANTLDLPFSVGRPATRAIHAGRAPDGQTAALGAPICQSTAFAHERVGVNRGHAYSRVSNPTVDALERALGALEDAPPAVCFRSGCAALAGLFFTFLRGGDEIVVSDVVYGGTVRLLRELLAEFGVTPRFVDTSDLDAVRRALTSRTRLVLLETPGNPTLKLTDVKAVADVCRAAGVPVAVDNTFLTPVLLRPLDLGADLAVYSTTKYHDGHGVSVGGAIVARDAAVLERLRRVRKTLGSIQAPHEAWLTLQGLRTLELRVRRHCENALTVARALESRPWVKRIVHPGLASFPQAELAARCAATNCGVLAFECAGGIERAKALLANLRLVRLAEHLGSIESLATHPATMSHADVPAEQRAAAGIGDGLVRLSVGLEDPEDIVDDLEQAHAAAEARDELVAATVVLKFGSSVLRNIEDLPTVVHEIYRHVRRSERVVAVVSAIGDTTDRLLQTARLTCDGATVNGGGGADADTSAVLAQLLATGEEASAALLAAALRRAGVPARVLDREALGLRTTGPTLSAAPVGLNDGAILAALAAAPVVVVPGFVGRDAVDGRPTLLGRGGSDLTAAFVAERIGAARCVLVKDVDGVYTSDPAHESSAPPRRYDTISSDEAVRVAAPLVQPQAIDAAARARLPLVVRAVGSSAGTTVGAGPSRLECEPADSRPLRVAVLGAGVVGGGLLERLAELPRLFDVRAVLARDADRAAASGVPRDVIVPDFGAILAAEPEVIVELIGGIEPAATWIERALDAGCAVVTANKALLAAHGNVLRATAQRAGVPLLASASVGGAAPVLEALAATAGDGLVELEAALSGTCNSILERLAAGADWAAAIAEAQRLGLAERDPADDLHGHDLARKLAVIALWSNLVPLRGGAAVTAAGVSGGGTGGIADLDPAGVRAAARSGRRTLLVGRIQREGSQATAEVRCETVDATHPFHGLRGAEVAARWWTADGREHLVRGTGAGRWPTAEAVIGDLLELRETLRPLACRAAGAIARNARE